MRRLALFLSFLPLLSAPAAQPNVLFIAVDDLRPELGCYGAPHARTPNIDRLAARGIVFDKAYCQQAVCSPSRSSLLTGLRPDVTKVWDLVTHYRANVPDCVSLPQHFRENGYHTASLGKIEHHGFEDGRSWSEPSWHASGQTIKVDPDDWTKHSITAFSGIDSEFANPVSRAEARKSGSGRSKQGPAFEISPKADDDLPDGATAAEAVKRLPSLKAAGKPFFLAVGFVKPHLPFVAPKKYWDMHNPDTIPVPAIGTMPTGTPVFVGHTNSELHAYPGVPKEEPVPADFAKVLRHGYNACISFTDAQVGRLLDALDQQGLADNTIIILWGDHGWQLGEHGLWHKHTNFEIAARSPLLISVPKTTTAGRTCAAPVEFVDVYPTLAELCGLPIPQGLGGMSLKPFIENPNAPMMKPAISQFPKSSREHGGQLMGYSIRTEDWRCTFWRKRNAADVGFIELYDEKNDPAETVNLAQKPEHASLVASLKKHLPTAGSDAPPPTKVTDPKHPKKNKIPSSPQTPASADEPRDQRYDRLYPGKTKLTLEEYLAAQAGDKAAAKARFTKQDKDNDGSVTRQEFIGTPKK